MFGMPIPMVLIITIFVVILCWQVLEHMGCVGNRYTARHYCPNCDIKCSFMGCVDVSVSGGIDVGYYRCPRCKKLYNEWGDEQDPMMYHFAD